MNKEMLRKQADQYFNVWQELRCTQKALSEHTFLPKQTINAMPWPQILN